jgi:hypothetical protein
MLLMVTCGDSQLLPDIDTTVGAKPQAMAATTPAETARLATPTPRRVGNGIGDMAPEFNILLTTGETVSYSDFRRDSTPIFLFFFSTL